MNYFCAEIKNQNTQMKKIIFGFLLLIFCFNSYSQTLTFEIEQYQKALWMTTRFYGAQRMGEGVNWLINDYNYNRSDAPDWLKKNINAEYVIAGKSFTRDADQDYDLTGGWFDCGDFCLFGQTFYYSVYMLLLGYSEFTSGFNDLYSEKYSGYILSNNFNWEGKKGKSDNIPDILNECKYATDFILKAVKDDKTFYYEKGNGNYDHAVWCTSVFKSGLPKNEGGENNGTRDFGKATQYATSMAALAGAALASMSRLYNDYDVAYAYKCQEKAKIAYDFATKTAMGNSGTAFGNFYPAKEKYWPDLTILCAELYRKTKNKTYLNKCEEYMANWINEYNHNHVLCYNNTEDIALYAYCAALGESGKYYQQAKNALKTLAEKYSSKSQNKVLQWEGWGALRYVANQAFSLALNSKLSGETNINETVLRTVEYILGNNTKKFSYVVGLNGFGTDNFPKKPHHRNFYRSDAGDENSAAQKITSDYKYMQLGYLIGGSCNDGEYDPEADYMVNEGGIDYNCGLVGALGYIVEKIAPVSPQNTNGNTTITTLKLKTTPKKTVYEVGEKLDVTGGVITATFSDKTTKDVSITADMISGFSTQKGGKFTVTISYLGKSVAYQITVNKSETGIKVYPLPKTEYLKGEKFDPQEAQVMITYNDGTFDKAIDLTSDMISGFSTEEIGAKTATVTYLGRTFDLEITTLNSKVTSLKIHKTPNKTSYNQDETLDVTGGRVYIVYEDGSEDVLDLKAQMVKNFDSSLPGILTLEVSFGGVSDNYEIEIIETETPVETVKKRLDNVYSYDHTIKIENYEGKVEVFNISGRRVFSGTNVNEIYIEKQGIYIVRIGNLTKKVGIF